MKLIVIGLASLLLVSGCGYYGHQPSTEEVKASVDVADGYPKEVNQLDSKGQMHEVTYTKPPERIVTRWQNSVETLIALGVGDKIVAATGVPSPKYIKPEYREIYEKIPYKSMESPDMETTFMFEPDFLVGWFSTFQSKSLRSTEFWENRGIHTYIAASSYKNASRTVETEYNYILDLGTIVNQEKKAQELVNQMKTEIAQAEELSRNKPKQKTLIMELMGRNISIYGKETLAGNILEHVGGDLIDPGSNTLNLEEIIGVNPEVIFLVVVENDYDRMDELVNSLYEKPALENVDAIKNHRVYPIPLYMVYSSGVRTYDGIQTMAQGLYPELKKESKEVNHGR